MLLVAGSAAVRVASLLSRVRTMSCTLVARAFNLFCPPSMLTFFRRRLTFLCKRPSVQSLYRVPADRVGDCEGPLSVAQCFAALSGMATGKAPGIDGLPMKFYLKFWGVLGVDLVEVSNVCHVAGFLAKCQRRALITLTFKKGDRLEPAIGGLSRYSTLIIRSPPVR